MGAGLPGRRAVVTGAHSGIGRSIAELFAQEGASVVAVDLNAEMRARPPEGAFESVVTDVSDEKEVAELEDWVGRTLGGVDLVVNCAGVFAAGTVGEATTEDWDRLFTVNVKAPWIVIRAFLPGMIGGGGGVIVNVASAAGIQPRKGMAAYAASKAALISLTRSLALEYGDKGVRANCLCPGVIDTPMSDLARRDLGRQSPSQVSPLDFYPLGRIGRPDEVASAALFLASQASSYITGVALAVDAGRTLH